MSTLKSLGYKQHLDIRNLRQIDPLDPRVHDLRFPIDEPIAQLYGDTLKQHRDYVHLLYSRYEDRLDQIHASPLFAHLDPLREQKTRVAMYLIEREIQGVIKALLQFFPGGSEQSIMLLPVLDENLHRIAIRFTIPTGREGQAEPVEMPYRRPVALYFLDPAQGARNDWRFRMPASDGYEDGSWMAMATYHLTSGVVIPAYMQPLGTQDFR